MPASPRSWRRAFFYSVFGALLNIYPAHFANAKDLPQGSHILTMVVQLASRQETLATGEDGALGSLHRHGIRDEDIADGSVAVGFVYCCGGKVSRDTMWVFYVPPEFHLAVGDVVELEVGKPENKKHAEPGVINRVVQVRESFKDETGSCRWDPEDERMWARILYCDWMKSEGWKYKGGLSKTWYKPAPDTVK